MTSSAFVQEYERLTARLYSESQQKRSPVNIGALVDIAANLDPTKPALKWGEGAEESLNYGQLSEKSNRLAESLTGMGVRPGSRVAISLPQSPELATTHAAVLKTGAISMPVSRLYGESALASRLGLADPDLVICAQDLVAKMGAALCEAEVNAPVISAGTLGDASSELSKLIDAGDPAFRPFSTDRDDPALLLFTSGTTGQPKGVLQAHRVVPGHAASLGLAYNLYPRQDSVLWTPADWSWAGGLVNCLFFSWLTATTIICAPDAPFEVESSVALIEAAGVTAAFLPPTALRRMKQTLQRPILEKLRLSAILTGSETLDPELIAWCVEFLGARPNEVYGQTEASAVAGNNLHLPARPGSVGRPYPGSRVVVLRDDDSEAAPGEEGELAVEKASESVFLRYWNDAEATAAKFGDKSSTWMRMGDLGVIDEHGYLWFRERRDDVIKSAGYRIGPSEVEACLRRHPAVEDVAVVGLPDPDRGNLVAAFVELRGPDQVDVENLKRDLTASVATRLSPFQRPRLIEIVDQLPRTNTGKVRRSAIRERYEKESTTK